jgi:hypothetical protein
MRFLALLLLLIGSAALAQLRSIPKEAQHGQIRHLEAMVIELNGKPAQLSAGAQIRDPDNRLVLPASLTEKVDVGYTLDGAGLVHRVWILSERERAMLPKPVPATETTPEK